MAAEPDEQLARRLVVDSLGVEPTSVRRFPTGLMHYVYEAEFASRPSVVVRIAAHYGHAAMRGAAHLSRLLRPQGVPLPTILAENLEPPFPHLILERLPGTDLGNVITDLAPSCLESIANAVTDAQRIAAHAYTPGSHYGFAVSPAEAPHPSWAALLAASLNRSRERIATGGVYNVSEIDPLGSILTSMQAELSSIPATPFLHDTTTKNVIVTAEGRFSGIVDVDDLCFGDPLFVIVLTHVALITRNLPTVYTEAWMRKAGFTENRRFHLYMALFLADFMSERGQRFNGNGELADRDYDVRLSQLFRDALGKLR